MNFFFPLHLNTLDWKTQVLHTTAFDRDLLSSPKLYQLPNVRQKLRTSYAAVRKIREVAESPLEAELPMGVAAALRHLRTIRRKVLPDVAKLLTFQRTAERLMLNTLAEPAAIRASGRALILSLPLRCLVVAFAGMSRRRDHFSWGKRCGLSTIQSLQLVHRLSTTASATTADAGAEREAQPRGCLMLVFTSPSARLSSGHRSASCPGDLAQAHAPCSGSASACSKLSPLPRRLMSVSEQG